MSVFVVDTNKVPLAPCNEAKARILLDAGKAAIWKRYPFTIILKYAVESPVVPDLRIKLDPGSKTTGIAVVDDQSGKIVFAAELTHRGHTIKESLDSRRAVRRGRRNRRTRYRQARWQNRRRREGWLCPSLQSRIANILTWVARLFCTYQPERVQVREGLSDRGSRQGCCHQWQESRHLYGTRCGTCYWLIQYHNCKRGRTGN